MGVTQPSLAFSIREASPVLRRPNPLFMCFDASLWDWHPQKQLIISIDVIQPATPGNKIEVLKLVFTISPLQFNGCCKRIV
ncbi:hypothetical protein SLE2022_345920 [Rubroshorea leprosula]